METDKRAIEFFIKFMQCDINVSSRSMHSRYLLQHVE
jgi:hypothetical protein